MRSEDLDLGDQPAGPPTRQGAQLEAALGQRYRWQVQDLDSYIGHPEFQLVKLHGSVNWARPVKQTWRVNKKSEVQRWLFDRAGQYEVSESIVLAGSGTFMRDGTPLMPALAVPVQNKSRFECPADHVELLRRGVWETTRLLSIGGRGVERHFTGMWADRNDAFELLAVSGSEAAGLETVGNLNTGGLASADAKTFDGGFGAFLGSGRLREFLGIA